MFSQVQQGAAVWEGGLGCEHCTVRLAAIIRWEFHDSIHINLQLPDMIQFHDSIS